MAMGETKCYTSGSVAPELDNGKLIVYSMRFCPFAERVRLLLNVKHVPYDVVNIHLKKKPDWYLLRNPLGKVPAIQIPGKKPLLAESLICAEYLDEAYPCTKTVLAEDLFERARQKYMIEIISQKITSPFKEVLYESNSNASEALLEALDFVDAMMDADYFAGEKMGFVDLMIWPWFERLPALFEIANIALGFPQSRFPRLTAWCERMLADPDVIATAHPKELFLRFMRSVREGFFNYDEGL